MKKEIKKEIDVTSLIEKIESLEKKDAENQAKLKMLYEVADKGRIFNYENRISEKKPMKVSLSVHEGNIIVGWRTIKDVLIKNPTTGLTVGEEQQYEILLLDKEGGINKVIINGYPRFTEIRYTERITCEVVGKKEGFDGNITFSVNLPDGRTIDLDAKFIN